MSDSPGGSKGRVAVLRRMLEESDKVDLFSRRSVSRKPWDFAAKRMAKTQAEAERAVLQPERILSDMSVKVEDAVEEGDRVVVRWRLRGKWSQPFAGLKPNGQVINISGVSTYRFVGDKIVEEDGEFDVASLAQQVRAGGNITAEACVSALDMLSRPPEETVFRPAGPARPAGPVGSAAGSGPGDDDRGGTSAGPG